MLFLVNHFFSWMIQSDISTTAVHIPCHILKSLEGLSATHFGHWKDSFNTVRATVNLVVCQRLLGEEAKATETEDELTRSRIDEERAASRHKPGRPFVHLKPGTLGIERLHIEYKRRHWYSESVRIYQPVFDDFINTLGLSAEATVMQLKFLCELYGRLSKIDELKAILKKLEPLFQNGDMANKEEIRRSVEEASRWCYLTKVYESCWHLIDWVVEWVWPLAAQTWRLGILRDAADVAERTGRLGQIPDIIALCESVE
jgi:hypothetical protein